MLGGDTGCILNDLNETVLLAENVRSELTNYHSIESKRAFFSPQSFCFLFTHGSVLQAGSGGVFFRLHK